MDYTDVLNSINLKLSFIVQYLETLVNDLNLEFLGLLFVVFFVLWYLRGE